MRLIEAEFLLGQYVRDSGLIKSTKEIVDGGYISDFTKLIHNSLRLGTHLRGGAQSDIK